MGANRVRTVLVVDDVEMNRDMLTAVLEDEYQVISAENGQEALDVLRGGALSVSAVLLDLMMPVMDGRTCLKEIKADPALRDIPVLVVTGDRDQDSELECLDLGASDFIPKPINALIAKKRVEAAVRLRESNAALSMVGTNSDTGLLTRNAFAIALEDTLKRHSSKTFTVAVFIVPDFSSVCANFGPDIVKNLLEVTGAYAAADPDNYSSAYLGEGRFALLRADGTVERLHERAALITSEALIARDYDFSFRCGVVEGVKKGDKAPIVLNSAIDVVRRIEHDSHVRIAYYDAEAEKALERRRTILAAAKPSLENGDFFVVYQPKHNAHTGALVGCEALVRWNHPTLGFVSPGEFIPLFEETGLVADVDAFVRRTLCKDMIAWHDAGLDPISASSNFSRKELESCSYIATVIEEVHADDALPADLLHAEVTETMWSNDADAVKQSLQLLKDAGHKIELDDFGSGYSSLSMVAALPLDVIKLDMSLVREIDTQEPVIECAVELSHKLGRTVVAEGVEDAETAARLDALGVDVLQGYYFSRPLPRAEFIEYIRAAQAGR